MKIYLVNPSNLHDLDFDESIGVVVVADSVNDAIDIAKKECPFLHSEFGVSDIGIAHDDQKRGVVLHSLNNQ